MCLLAAGGIGYHDDRFIEYDLDKEDQEWLEAFNKGQDRLPARRMELLMWRLECANAEATDRALAAAGESPWLLRHLSEYFTHIKPLPHTLGFVL